jgi:hypothetical protein
MFPIDSSIFYHYIASVRWVAILIAVLLLHDIFVPSPSSNSLQDDGVSAVVSLDDCYQPPSEPVEDEKMPSLAEYSRGVLPDQSSRLTASFAWTFNQSAFSAPTEHPPKA